MFHNKPNAIHKFYKLYKKNNCDIVSSTRYVSNNSGIYGWDNKRKIISRGANILTKIILGQESTDFTGSYRLYKRECFEDIIKKVKNKGYVFQMEILVRKFQ